MLRKRNWIGVALIVGVLIGAAFTIAYRPVAGPPDGTFWAVVLLPLLQLLASWPVVAGVTIAVFRTELAELIRRIKKLPGGTELEVLVAVAAQEAAIAEKGEITGSGDVTVKLVGVSAVGKVGDVTVSPPPASATAAALPPTAQMVENLEPAVASRFADLAENLAAGRPTDERLTVALLELADLQLRYVFEKVYRMIVGSQIDALLYLKARPLGATEQEIRAIYNRNPETAKALAWETWRYFVTSATGFLSVENERFVITPTGAQFLFYLLSQGLTDRKDF